MYYYLPLGHVFGGVPPGVTDKTIWTRGVSPLIVERISGKDSDFEYRLSSRQEPVGEISANCLALADIFVEILYLSYVAISRANTNVTKVGLSAFRHGGDFHDSSRNRNTVSIDVLCASFFTADCTQTKFHGLECDIVDRLDVELDPDHVFKCDAPGSEFKSGNFVFCLQDSNIDPTLSDAPLISMACFPSFYEDYRCFGTALVSKAGDKTILRFNGVPLDRIKDLEPPTEVSDTFHNGTLPVLLAVSESGTFGFDHKLMVMFGAIAADGTDSTDRKLKASTAFFTLGLRCNQKTADAIASEIAFGIRSLQTVLFSITTSIALDELNTKARLLEENELELKRQTVQLTRAVSASKISAMPITRACTDIWSRVSPLG
jgi:hypothetical protein